jgi:hypothetical protein
MKPNGFTRSSGAAKFPTKFSDAGKLDMLNDDEEIEKIHHSDPTRWMGLYETNKRTLR